MPILVAFFQAVDEGKVQLDQMLTLKPEHIVGGSGEMQDDTPGKKYSALEVAKKMIVVSDNTATNMMIELLGGAEVLNQHFATWGLRATVLRNKLPDLEGTNTTSPKDLINIIAQVDRGNVVSVKSRDRLFQIMRQTQNDSLLPKGLGEGSVIAHKTGNINTMLADAGMGGFAERQALFSGGDGEASAGNPEAGSKFDSGYFSDELPLFERRGNASRFKSEN